MAPMAVWWLEWESMSSNVSPHVWNTGHPRYHVWQKDFKTPHSESHVCTGVFPPCRRCFASRWVGSALMCWWAPAGGEHSLTRPLLSTLLSTFRDTWSVRKIYFAWSGCTQESLQERHVFISLSFSRWEFFGGSCPFDRFAMRLLAAGCCLQNNYNIMFRNWAAHIAATSASTDRFEQPHRLLKYIV